MPANQQQATPATGATRPRVLIVEDDAECARWYAITLETAFDVEVVNTFALAVSRIKSPDKPRVDGILVDCNLPNGKGIDTIDRFQNLVPQVSMTVVSGFPYHQGDLIRAGAQSFLQKPHSASELLEHVIGDIARHQVRQQFHSVDQLGKEIKEGLRDASDSMCAALKVTGEDTVLRAPDPKSEPKSRAKA